MIEIDKPKIEIVDLSTQGSRSVGKFVVEPLERGSAQPWATVCGECCSPLCPAMRSLP